MKAAVVTFPGSNCDDDCVFALEKLCQFEVDRLWHKETPSLDSYDLIVLPGGFSYGDYLRCGAIAALSPVIEKVKQFGGDGGIVLGICNGFQMLCEMGLLPGALAKNDHLNFVCKEVEVEVMTTDSPWTCKMGVGDKLALPIAHGDGRFVISEKDYEDLKRQGQIIFSYTVNPNGSAYGIAGICNQKKNILGLMPHPERATDLGSRDGMKIWKSLKHHLEEHRQ